jgi:hypothetical protein
MNDRDERYSLSLRIWHPRTAPTMISDQLGLSPTHQWAAGSIRTTPAGTPLSGRHDSTYWSARLRAGRGETLVEALEQTNARLTAHADFLQAILEAGGRIEYFVGWFAESNTGFVLPSQLLASTSELGIDLAFDIYGPNRSG